ncbi:aspartyl-phosphate phosphatase Spo0E family protein [Paenibacillus solani]|uniref:aspartyl-phosphate phosphatase Spo0E family protein n=1 Tax=Paenibacillus solani TaxID=1705565 RepID=UPI0009EC8861|nr:aspartyl-phosphate phosphatase Spo0E family protein [Paenibacillus solani]
MLLDDLREQIETFRFHLYELVEKYGITDPNVLAKSSELDELLNQYQKHYAENKKII